jgi:hypothetical protein
MRRLSVVLAIGFIAQAGLSHAQMTLVGRTTVVFATIDEGRQILATRDDFVQRMSAFDRAARMKTARQVPEEEFLKHVRQNVLAWSSAEEQVVESAFKGIRSSLETMRLAFPDKIYLVKTTGNEEGGAAYTRGSAIVLPKGELAGSMRAIRRLVCHELFHVLSRANPELREQLYEAIGFVKCNEIEFPARLAPRKITNPDAPRNDHYIRVQLGGQECLAVPILLANTERYDATRGGEFFDYLQFQLLLVERGKDPGSVKLRYDGDEPRLVDLRRVAGFFEQVGRNTGYIIHPEEVLADNFALLLMDTHDVPSPAILKKIKDILTARRAGEPGVPVNPAESRR